MSKIKLLLVVSVLFLVSGCAKYEKVTSYGSKHLVTQYSGGIVVNRWLSKGKVLSEANSDGYYFFTTDGKFIEVSGTVKIERE